MQVIGLHIESLAEMVKRHAELCGRLDGGSHHGRLHALIWA
jgi:hypothetical protein